MGATACSFRVQQTSGIHSACPALAFAAFMNAGEEPSWDSSTTAPVCTVYISLLTVCRNKWAHKCAT